MAARCNKEDALTPRGSSLEADDGCQFFSGGHQLAKQHLIYGGGRDECDSGVDMVASIGCDLLPSIGSTQDPSKPQLTDFETPSTCVSVGYTSFSGPEDVRMDAAALEGQMEMLDIGAGEVSSAVTTTTSCAMTTPCPVMQSDPRKAFIDRVQLYFTPDDDGDT